MFSSELTPIEIKFEDAAKDLIPSMMPQQWIGPYRIDFVIPEKKVAIELDGHDFHKTKEQRTRDAKQTRYLIKQGYMVIRFTGTEIWKSPGECVSEVLEISSTRPHVSSSGLFHPAYYACSGMSNVIRSLLAAHSESIEHENAAFTLKRPYYDPLCIQKDGDRVTIYHYYENNDDIIFDPSVQFGLVDGPLQDQEWTPLVIEQIGGNPRRCAELHENGNLEILDFDLQMEIANYVENWSQNIISAGWFSDGVITLNSKSE